MTVIEAFRAFADVAGDSLRGLSVFCLPSEAEFSAMASEAGATIRYREDEEQGVETPAFDVEHGTARMAVIGRPLAMTHERHKAALRRKLAELEGDDDASAQP